MSSESKNPKNQKGPMDNFPKGSIWTALIITLALVLLIIGGLNWGLVGIFSFDLVAWMFGGQGAVLSRIVYIIVALSAAWCISLLFRERDAADEA